MRRMAAQPDQILTIAQLIRRIKAHLERGVGEVWISGEISNWRVSGNGHAYFTLKDESGQVSAVMFRGALNKVKFAPGDGLEVLAHGLVTVYEKRGDLQLVLDDMQPKGMGALQLAFERLKAKLQAEGLFDDAHKKPLPLLPRRIGVVTSPTGAAIRDILHVIRRRFANVHVILYPARVQGDEAAKEIAAAINFLDRWGVDVMIVGRGGGSLEDLWPFNEEPVVRAIFAAKTPVISAVGHEIDFTLADFVADLRAPTPSAAAEMVVKEQAALLDTIALKQRRLHRAASELLARRAQRLDSAKRHYLMQRPEELLRGARQACDDAHDRLNRALLDRAAALRARLDRAARGVALLSPAQRLQRGRERIAAQRARLAALARTMAERPRAQLAPLAGRLHALSPLAILGRGYALTRHLPDRTLIRSSEQLRPDDVIEVRFGAGAARAVVREILPPESVV